MVSTDFVLFNPTDSTQSQNLLCQLMFEVGPQNSENIKMYCIVSVKTKQSMLNITWQERGIITPQTILSVLPYLLKYIS